MNTIGKNLLWSVLSGVLLSLPWLVPHTGLVLLVAFVPLLWLEHAFYVNGRVGCWKYYALTFLIWNALTVFWVVNSTVAGGLFAVVGNAFQMFVIFAAFRWVKRCLGKWQKPLWLSYLFLAALWIAWEHFYFDAEISFPWLVLGNGFAWDIRLVQWYEATGALGGSLWALVSNLLLFGLLTICCKPASASPKPRPGFFRPLYAGVLLGVWVVAPMAVSLGLFYTYEETGRALEVVVVQPNIDPTPSLSGVSAKFGGMTQEQQDTVLLRLARQEVTAATDFVFAPETCTQNVVEGRYEASASMAAYQRFVHEYPQLSFVFGASTVGIYPPSREKPTPSARKISKQWYDAFNAALCIDAAQHVQVYHKSKLVVGAEKMPYIDKFAFIEKLALDFGGTTGTLGTQTERTVFEQAAGKAKVGVAICYESIYGQFFTEYVKKGADVMAVITNDGWWGDTPGYRHHAAYASLRAIETRRSVARSANTGLSCLVNQRGERLMQTIWWQEAALKGQLRANDRLTFYVRHGDYIGRIAGWLCLAVLCCCLVIYLTARPLRRGARGDAKREKAKR